MNIKTNINTTKIMRERGIGGDNRAQKFLASEVARLCDPYIPFQQGMLKNNTQIASDGSQLVYNQPYAHYQYYGEVMAGKAPKHYTGKPLNYHDAPMRGPKWERRMMADKSKELTESLKQYIGRLVR